MAFESCSELQSLTIGNSVKSIGNGAFASCSALQSLTIPDSVTSIGQNAFERCSELQSVSIGDGVTSIGTWAFYYCSALQSVTIGNSVTSISPYAFQECSALQSVTIPDSVTSIGNYAFQHCYDLQSLTIPDSVTSIGNYAFSVCSSLQTVSIPDSVTSIGNNAFEFCLALQSVTIGNKVQKIDDYAFDSCRALLSLTIPDSVTTISDTAFPNSGLTTLYMSENNGLKFDEGSQSVGEKTVNVIFFSKDAANNYDGPEYFGNPNAWDVSLITDLSYVFFKKDQTNHPDISTWNVSNVTTMQGTFSNSTFNGELKNWNVASVTDFSYTFANNVVFNQELKRWNVQDATTMESMFDNAYSFNQNIEPPMVQNKNGTDFPTQLTWDESTINGYLTTIYGDATPQTNPTTFKGVFGMIALLKKTYLDNIPDDPVVVVGKYNTIKSSFSEVISELITNQQEILKYNYTYNETDGWTKPEQSIFSKNTKDESGNDLEGDDLKEARDSLNQLRLNTIVDGMLLINKAYDIAKGLGPDYSDLISEMKKIYDDVYAGLPFYVAWYAPLLTTKANFLNNAFTFHNGATTDSNDEKATIDQKLTDFIDTNPIKTINGKDYSSTDKQVIVKSSSDDLFVNFKAAYTS